MLTIPFGIYHPLKYANSSYYFSMETWLLGFKKESINEKADYARGDCFKRC